LVSINALALDPSTHTVWGAAANRIYIWQHLVSALLAFPHTTLAPSPPYSKSLKCLRTLIAIDDDKRAVSALLGVRDAYSVPSTVHHVVWASCDDEIVVWTSECQRIQELNIGLPVVRMVQLDATVLVASRSSLLIVDIASFARVARWDAHTQRISSADAAADFIWSGARDKLLCVWRADVPATTTTASRLVKALRRHKKKITSVAAVPIDPSAAPVSPRQRGSVWSASEDKLLVLWDAVQLCERVVLSDLPAVVSHLIALPAEPDGTCRVVGGVDDRSSLLLAAVGPSASFKLQARVAHEFSDPVPSKPVRCALCLKKIRDDVTFCLVCELCVHNECAPHVRSTCVGAPVVAGLEHQQRLETHVLLSPRSAAAAQRSSTPRSIGASGLAIVSSSGTDAHGTPPDTSRAVEKGTLLLTALEALAAARDFGARYVGHVRRLDAVQVRSVQRLVSSIMHGAAVRELYVALRSSVQRVDLRALKRLLVSALLPLKHDLAVQAIAPFSVPLSRLNYRVYCASVQGARDYMEDRYAVVEFVHELHDVATHGAVPETVCLGVFDGHEGARAAQYAMTHIFANTVSHRSYASNLSEALVHGFVETDRAFNEMARMARISDGSTATCVLLRDDRLVCAWVGDSDALLCRGGRARLLTRKHTPDRKDEAERIVRAGGTVSSHGLMRVNQTLAVTRSIGDRELAHIVIAEPEIVDLPITDEDEWLLLGSDGLFDVFDADELVTIVQRWAQNHDRSTICQALIDEAGRRNSTDNITALIVFFNIVKQDK
jgi:serine/threonine protein phosphatase PrpC